MCSIAWMEISYLLVLSWFRDVMIFLKKSCWIVVCRVCWADDSFTQIDTSKVCIPSLLRRVQMELSWVAWLSWWFFFDGPDPCCPWRGPGVGMMMPKFQWLINSSCDGKVAKFSCSSLRFLKVSLCFPTCHVQIWCVEYVGPMAFVVAKILIAHVFYCMDGDLLFTCFELVSWCDDFFEEVMLDCCV